jgi:hypothetical protein
VHTSKYHGDGSISRDREIRREKKREAREKRKRAPHRAARVREQRLREARAPRPQVDFVGHQDELPPPAARRRLWKEEIHTTARQSGKMGVTNEVVAYTRTPPIRLETFGKVS